MSEGILGNATGGFGFPKTYILTDEHGNELTGVYVESETVFTATDNDVREGMVYASDSGVSVGQKNIPPYHTTTGKRLIKAGADFTIVLNNYDYTELQAMICNYGTSLVNSCSVDRVGINDNVYPVESTEVLSTITKDSSTRSINFGITNNTENKFVIRYITYKEIY
jgi:hypothetical protein